MVAFGAWMCPRAALADCAYEVARYERTWPFHSTEEFHMSEESEPEPEPKPQPKKPPNTPSRSRVAKTIVVRGRDCTYEIDVDFDSERGTYGQTSW